MAAVQATRALHLLLDTSECAADDPWTHSFSCEGAERFFDLSDGLADTLHALKCRVMLETGDDIFGLIIRRPVTLAAAVAEWMHRQRRFVRATAPTHASLVLTTAVFEDFSSYARPTLPEFVAAMGIETVVVDGREYFCGVRSVVAQMPIYDHDDFVHSTQAAIAARAAVRAIRSGAVQVHA